MAGVVSQPDRPKGRGRKLEPTPVKLVAEKHGLPLIQPESLRKDPGPLEWIKNLHPDLLIVVAYGLILPASLLDVPQDGGWNVHASMLPKYRGAAPIEWAILRGETKTGITLMQMDAGMDTGDIILQEETEIGPEETGGQVTGRLTELGKELLLEGLQLRDEGRIRRRPQENSLATLAPMIEKEDREIDWNDTAINIHDKIRGFNPRPGARAGDLKLLRSRIIAQSRQVGTPPPPLAPDVKPGVALDVIHEGIWVATGEGILLLTEVQHPGGRPMPAADYARGRHLKPGQKIGLISG